MLAKEELPIVKKKVIVVTLTWIVNPRSKVVCWSSSVSEVWYTTRFPPATKTRDVQSDSHIRQQLSRNTDPKQYVSIRVVI